MGMEKITKIKKIVTKTRPIKTVYNIQVEGGDTFCLNGIVIHNSVVEFGSRGYKISGDQYVTVKVPKPKRTKSGRKSLRSTKVGAGYVRVYHNKRLIPIKDKSSGKIIYRVITEVKERKGKFFLTNSVREGIQSLPADIGRSFSIAKNVRSVQY